MPSRRSAAPFAGGTLYLFGMLGTGDSAEAAATNVLTSIQNTLKAAEMTMDDQGAKRRIGAP